MRRVFAFVLLLASASVSAFADRAVTLDGNILEKGRYDKKTKEFVTGREKSERRHAIAQFALIETDTGSHLHSADLAARLRAYRYLAARERKKRLVAVLDTAYASLDKALVREVFERAQRDGFGGKKAEKFKKRLEKLEKKTLRTGPRKDKVEKVRKVLDGTATVYTNLLMQRIEADIESERETALVLLRELFRLAPKHAKGLQVLKKVADPKFTLGGPRLWLDWHLDLEPAGVQIGTGSANLSRFRAVWRKDIFEVDAGPVRLFTPVKDTAVIGRCLAWGQLTCKALEQIFKTEKPFRRASKGLAVLLYASQKEYMTTTGTGREVRNPGFLEWTSGHYTPMERLSRFYWHKGRDAERRIARTFVHELTHHWIDELCPRFADSQRRRSGNIPGYWVVEGFATLMEEGRYDLDNGTWNFFDARATSIDTVHALTGTGKLIDWPKLITMTQRHQMTLSSKPGMKMVRRWAMGERNQSLARLYYEQSAAICQFLYHAENGKYRERLADFVVNYYTGRAEKLDAMAAFGLTATELGKRVEQFAKDVADGWRPKARK
ncbi:MAG: hypothetical protein V3T86_10805 [Planctomycetota bacterium]